MNSDDDVSVDPDTSRVETRRLRLRPWSLNDVEAALQIFGDEQVTRWLTPALNHIANRDDMAELLEAWIVEDDRGGLPLGRWAIEHPQGGSVIGAVALLRLPPEGNDLEIGWQIAPSHWGHGYGAEAGHAVAHQAFAGGATEVFAVVRPGNHRGIATARRVGMDWVGETTKYYGMRLQVYRLTKADLDYSDPAAL
jgi:RimJ/RimL family protein N-acetyltransferase